MSEDVAWLASEASITVIPFDKTIEVETSPTARPMVEEKAAFREGEASQAAPAERQSNRLDELTRKGKMNGKSLLHMYHEQKLADELARDRHTEAPAVFIAVALFVVVFVVGAALDTAWVYLQQWYHVAASHWPF